MPRRLAAAVVVGALAILWTRLLRHYPWTLAGLSGASLGALTFASLQTLVRLRATLAQYGPRPKTPDVEASWQTPGAEPERDDQ